MSIPFARSPGVEAGIGACRKRRRTAMRRHSSALSQAKSTSFTPDLPRQRSRDQANPIAGWA